MLYSTQQRSLSFSSFWREDPVRRFHYAEAEFFVANLQLNSYLCYSHILHALSPEVIATVWDKVCTIMPDTPDAYLLRAFCRPRSITASSCWACIRWATDICSHITVTLWPFCLLMAILYMWHVRGDERGPGRQGGTPAF